MLQQRESNNIIVISLIYPARFLRQIDPKCGRHVSLVSNLESECFSRSNVAHINRRPKEQLLQTSRDGRQALTDIQQACTQTATQWRNYTTSSFNHHLASLDSELREGKSVFYYPPSPHTHTYRPNYQRCWLFPSLTFSKANWEMTLRGFFFFPSSALFVTLSGFWEKERERENKMWMRRDVWVTAVITELQHVGEK